MNIKLLCVAGAPGYRSLCVWEGNTLRELRQNQDTWTGRERPLGTSHFEGLLQPLTGPQMHRAQEILSAWERGDIKETLAGPGITQRPYVDG